MQTLTPEFMKEHSLSEVVTSFDGGQKIVYIVKDLNGQMLAMKFFRNCNNRDIQEIEILKKFKFLPGISKVIRVEKYKDTPLLFEEYIDGQDLQDIQTEYTGDAQKIAVLIKDIAVILKPIWSKRI